MAQKQLSPVTDRDIQQFRALLSNVSIEQYDATTMPPKPQAKGWSASEIKRDIGSTIPSQTAPQQPAPRPKRRLRPGVITPGGGRRTTGERSPRPAPIYLPEYDQSKKSGPAPTKPATPPVQQSQPQAKQTSKPQQTPRTPEQTAQAKQMLRAYHEANKSNQMVDKSVLNNQLRGMGIDPESSIQKTLERSQQAKQQQQEAQTPGTDTGLAFNTDAIKGQIDKLQAKIPNSDNPERLKRRIEFLQGTLGAQGEQHEPAGKREQDVALAREWHNLARTNSDPMRKQQIENEFAGRGININQSVRDAIKRTTQRNLNSDLKEYQNHARVAANKLHYKNAEAKRSMREIEEKYASKNIDLKKVIGKYVDNFAKNNPEKMEAHRQKWEHRRQMEREKTKPPIETHISFTDEEHSQAENLRNRMVDYQENQRTQVSPDSQKHQSTLAKMQASHVSNQTGHPWEVPGKDQEEQLRNPAPDSAYESLSPEQKQQENQAESDFWGEKSSEEQNDPLKLVVGHQFQPKDHIDRAIAEQVGNDEVMRRIIRDEIKRVEGSGQGIGRDEALRAIIEQFHGKGSASRFIQNARRAQDSQSVNQQGKSYLPKFDQMVDYLRNNPELSSALIGAQGVGGNDDLEFQLQEALKQGFSGADNSASLVEKAIQSLGGVRGLDDIHNHYYGQPEDQQPDQNDWSNDWDPDYDPDEVIPFSRQPYEIQRFAMEFAEQEANRLTGQPTDYREIAQYSISQTPYLGPDLSYIDQYAEQGNLFGGAPEPGKPTENPHVRIDSTGMVWHRAPKGGLISSVNGRYYKGGQWTPVGNGKETHRATQAELARAEAGKQSRSSLVSRPKRSSKGQQPPSMFNEPIDRPEVTPEQSRKSTQRAKVKKRTGSGQGLLNLDFDDKTEQVSSSNEPEINKDSSFEQLKAALHAEMRKEGYGDEVQTEPITDSMGFEYETQEQADAADRLTNSERAHAKLPEIEAAINANPGAGYISPFDVMNELTDDPELTVEDAVEQAITKDLDNAMSGEESTGSEDLDEANQILDSIPKFDTQGRRIATAAEVYEKGNFPEPPSQPYTNESLAFDPYQLEGFEADYHWTPYEADQQPNNRRLAAAKRFNEKQKKKAGLFADQVEGELENPIDRIQSHDARTKLRMDAHSDSNAQRWREQLDELSKLPEQEQIAFRDHWNSSKFPKDSANMAGHLRKWKEGERPKGAVTSRDWSHIDDPDVRKEITRKEKTLATLREMKQKGAEARANRGKQEAEKKERIKAAINEEKKSVLFPEMVPDAPAEKKINPKVQEIIDANRGHIDNRIAETERELDDFERMYPRPESTQGDLDEANQILDSIDKPADAQFDPVWRRKGAEHAKDGLHNPSMAGLTPGTLPYKSYMQGMRDHQDSTNSVKPESTEVEADNFWNQPGFDGDFETVDRDELEQYMDEHDIMSVSDDMRDGGLWNASDEDIEEMQEQAKEHWENTYGKDSTQVDDNSTQVDLTEQAADIEKEATENEKRSNMFRASGAELTELAESGDQDAQAELDRRAENRGNRSMIMREYKNPKNGGRERVYREGDAFFISSNWGDGFTSKQKVSRSQVVFTLRYTNAPQDVIDEITK